MVAPVGLLGVQSTTAFVFDVRCGSISLHRTVKFERSATGASTGMAPSAATAIW